MPQTVTRLKFFARLLPSAALACACLAAPAAAQVVIDRPPPDQRQPPIRPPATIKREVLVGPPPEPSLKKPDAIRLPASRPPRSYDAKRDATYVNVDVTLLAHRAVKEPKGKGPLRFEGRELTLTFQLAYRGAQTYDLIGAYLILESTAEHAEADRLSALSQFTIKADPYEYSYERLDYQTEAVVPINTIAQQLRREVAAFRLPTEDLPQIAGAGRIVVKLGAETFNVASAQLTELRRTLAAGVSK